MSSQGAYSKEKRVVRHKSVELPAHVVIQLPKFKLEGLVIFYMNKKIGGVSKCMTCLQLDVACGICGTPKNRYGFNCDPKKKQYLDMRQAERC